MPLSFSTGHYEERVRRIRAAMKEHGFSAVVFCKCETVRYVTGFRRWYSYSWFYLREFALLSMDDGPVLLTDRGRMARAREDCYVTGVGDSGLWPIPRDDRDTVFKTLARCLSELGVSEGKVGWEYDALPTDFYLRLPAFSGQCELADFSPVMNKVIMVKFGEELEAVRQTAHLADIGLEAGVAAAQVGVSEQAIAAAVDYAMMSAGAERVSHNVVRTGRNVTTLNNIQTQRCIEPGDLVQLDLGGIYAGYIADVNLTYGLGQPGSELKRVTDVALDMERAGIEAIRPGLSLAELRTTIAAPAMEAGLGNFMVKDIGHGVGVYHQEYPKLAEDDGQLRPGMVLSIEPGLVVPNVGAARKEDMVLVTAVGHEVLTRFAWPAQSGRPTTG